MLPSWVFWLIIWWTAWFLIMLEWYNTKPRNEHNLDWLAWVLIGITAGFIPFIIVVVLLVNKTKQ